MRDSTVPISSSKDGCHSLGACTTPSMELNSPADTLRMSSLPPSLRTDPTAPHRAVVDDPQWRAQRSWQIVVVDSPLSAHDRDGGSGVVGGGSQFGYVQLGHLEHGLHGAAGAPGVGVRQQLVECPGDD